MKAPNRDEVRNAEILGALRTGVHQAEVSPDLDFADIRERKIKMVNGRKVAVAAVTVSAVLASVPIALLASASLNADSTVKDGQASSDAPRASQMPNGVLPACNGVLTSMSAFEEPIRSYATPEGAVRAREPEAEISAVGNPDLNDTVSILARESPDQWKVYTVMRDDGGWSTSDYIACLQPGGQ